MTAHEALLDLIHASGILLKGTTLFGSANAKLPTGPGPFGNLIAYQGPSSVGTHNAGTGAYRRPVFQMVVHAMNAGVARDIAFDLRDLLNLSKDPLVRAAGGKTLNGIWFLYVTPQGEPGEQPPDGQGRARWAFNVATMHKGDSA